MSTFREPVITKIGDRFRAKLYTLKETRVDGRIYVYDWGATAAEARAASYERQRKAGQVPIEALRKGEITLDDWMQQHFAHLEMAQRKGSTLYTYRKLYSLYIEPLLANMKLKDIAPVHINRVQQQMGKDRLSVPRIKNAMCLLNSALQRAYRMEIIPRNPVDLIEPLKREQANGHAVLSKDDLDRLLNAFAGTWWFDHVLMLVYTGMRRGEVLGLRRRDVDLEQNMLTVRCTLVEDGPDYRHQEHAKTAAGLRRVPLAPRLVEMLRARLEWTTECGPDGPVFPDRSGTWQRPTTFNVAFHRVMKRMGLKAWPHLLRHSHASILLRETGNLAQVSRHLGHANSAITARVYAHAMQDVDHGLADVIGEVLK